MQIYPPLIKPRPTEPNYTRSVSHIAECRHTLARHTLPIDPRATEPNYTRSVSHIEEYRHSCSPLHFHLIGDVTVSPFTSSLLVSHTKTSVTYQTKPPRKHSKWMNTRQVTQITYTFIYKHSTLHHLNTYSSTKYMQML